MESIVRWCLKNKSVVILATLLLVGSGAYATTRLNQELLPDISFPIITISTPVVGAGPDAVDEQVTQPVESAIGGVAGIEAVQSTSSAGFSVVVVEFDLEADTEEAEADLQAALDGVELPEQAGEPEVRSQSASEFPILTLSLAAKDQDLADLTDYAEDEVVPSIEEVEGVASVDLIGGAEKRVEVELDPDKLKDEGLSTDAVVGAVSGAKVDVPVGSVPVEGLETPVRAYETPDEAVLAAGQARLRPILMTAFATVFALLPLALGLSGGGNGLISSSLAITVVGGLATSTFLTLLVVPAGYSLLESGLRRKRKV